MKSSRDFYMIAAASLLEKPQSEVTPDDRRVVKTALLNALYGRTTVSVAQLLSIPAERLGKFLENLVAVLDPMPQHSNVHELLTDDRLVAVSRGEAIATDVEQRSMALELTMLRGQVPRLQDTLRQISELVAPSPLDLLNDQVNGGVRAGEICVVMGRTSSGKSRFPVHTVPREA